jgi:P-type E1-E2 ATPase
VYLEQLAKIDTVLLDKTGTLTYGKPHVALIEPAFGYEADELLRIAAAAERNSEHPLALAVVAAAQAKQLIIGEPSSFSYTPGKGIHAKVDSHAVVVGNAALLEEANAALPEMSTTAGTLVLISRDRQFVGSIQIADQVRDGASEAIRELQDMGLQSNCTRVTLRHPPTLSARASEFAGY